MFFAGKAVRVRSKHKRRYPRRVLLNTQNLLVRMLSTNTACVEEDVAGDDVPRRGTVDNGAVFLLLQHPVLLQLGNMLLDRVIETDKTALDELQGCYFCKEPASLVE
jgi:hypothetical protein